MRRLTDLLDLAGLLLLVACGAWGVGLLVGWPAVPGVAGVGLLLVSWLIDKRQSAPRKGER